MVASGWSFRLKLAQAGGVAFNAQALAYYNAVVSGGGTMSPQRVIALSRAITRLQAGGVWDAMDDFWMLAGENSTQSLISLKRLATSTPQGSPLPLYAANRGMIFDGTQNYLDTGFRPLTDGTKCSSANTQISVYESGNVTGGGIAAGSQTNGNGNLRLDPNTGNVGSGVSATINGTAWTGPATSSALGLTSAFRNGVSSYGVYFNGANQAGVTPPGVDGNSQSAHSIFIGAWNLVGTASNFRSTTIPWVAVGSALTQAQEAIHYASVQALLLEIGAFDIYLSANSFGGIPAGNDSTGVGSITNPWAGLDKALANLNPFGTIKLNGNPASPSVYQSTNAFGSQISAGCTMQALHTGGAVIAGNNANVGAVIGGVGVFNFTGIVFDPSLGATPGADAVRFTSNTASYTANFTTCTFQNWTTYACRANAATMRASLNFTNCTMTGNACSGATLLQTFDQGGFAWSGGSITITNQKTTGVGGIVVGCTNTGPTFSLSGNPTISITLDATLVGGGAHSCLRVQDFAAPVIGACTLLGDNSGTSRSINRLWIEGITLGTTGGSATGVLVGGATTLGVGILVGEDGPVSRTLMQNFKVNACGSTGVVSGTAEHVVFGSSTNCSMNGANTFVGGQVIGAKDCIGFAINPGLTWTGWIGQALVDKGNTNSVFDSPLMHDTAGTGSNIFLTVEANVDTGLPCTGGTYHNCDFSIEGTTGSVFINQDAASSVGAITSCTLAVTSGTPAAHPVQIGAVNYDTGAAFVAAYPGNTTSGW